MKAQELDEAFRMALFRLLRTIVFDGVNLNRICDRERHAPSEEEK